MNKKIIFFLLVVLYFPSIIYAETIVLKSGETLEGKILEKTEDYIKIDFQGIPLTYYLKDIETIDGKSVLSKANPLENESPINQTNTSLTQEDSATTYENDEYGITIIGPKDWTMKISDSLRKQQQNDEFSYKMYDLVRYSKNYGEPRTPEISFSLSETYSAKEPFPGLENTSKGIIDKSGATLLQSPESGIVNGKKYIKYCLEMPGTNGQGRVIMAFFESKKGRAAVLLMMNAVIKTEDWDSAKPVVERTINSVILK